jgi:CRISPR-associated exonuclease Cas4
MFDDAQIIPISALQHWLYCPRQCALIHLEQAWSENKFTAEGRVMHENAHEGADETKAGVRITRGMPVVSEMLGLAGQCDVVEFHAACGGDPGFGIPDVIDEVSDGGDSGCRIPDLNIGATESAPEPPAGNFKSQITNPKCTRSVLSVLPVEYKRGKPKAHRADEVQLCAQAMCLEEMLGVVIPAGAMYYGEKRRRMEVKFDDVLRDLVRRTTAEARECFASGRTPLAEYDARRCDACSLIDECQPLAMRFKKGAAAWFSANLKSQI